MPSGGIEHGGHGSWLASGRVLIVAWHKGLMVDDLERFHAATRAMDASCPDGFAVLSFSYTDTPLPTAETREAIVTLNKSPAASYRGTVVLLQGEGFGASVARSLIAALNLIRKGAAREIVVKDYAEAVAKLRTLTTVDDEAALRADCDALLAAVGRPVTSA